MTGVTRREVVDGLAQHRTSEVMATIFERFQSYRGGVDMVVVEGTHEDGVIFYQVHNIKYKD